MAKQSKQAQEAQEAPPPPPPSPPKQATVNGTMVVAPDQDPWDLSGAYYIGPNGGHVWHPLVPPPPIPADQLDWSGFETAGQGELLPEADFLRCIGVTDD